MKKIFLKIKILLLTLLFFFSAGISVQANDFIENSGNVLTIALPVAAAGMTVGLKDWQGTLQFAESNALSLAVTYGLRFAVDETRPNGESRSFPSSHTSAAFTSAEFMRKHYGWLYGIPAYVVASYVGYSRIESKQHYAHDVLAGAAIGIASNYFFTKPYKGWRIQPEVDHTYYGIRLCFNW